MTTPQAHTSARPLAWLYAALIVYASLYPFGPWRDQDIAPWTFLWAPRTPYWTAFDVASNLLGYAPLGFGVTLSVLRQGRTRKAWLRGWLTGCALSFLMESMQSYLPMRVPSQSDWLLNTLGAGLGAGLAQGLERRGFLLRYSAMRQRWFVNETHGTLPLLLTWPFALLFPLPIPLGLGQVFERLENFLAAVLTDTPFLEWLPMRAVELQPLMPATQSFCVALGLCLPVLLVFSVMPQRAHRVHALWVLHGLAWLVSSLSVALTFGPAQAWAWLTPPVWVGLGLGLSIGIACLWLPMRICLVLLLVVTLIHSSWVNLAPNTVYYDLTLQIWEQGRFIRFNGLAQWLGWVWPYVLMADVMRRLARA
ncbi:MAG: VanZ family protein [Alphaproteobacteria bacterium]|nr:VanZ family protein [Alphaproteobacteria bacterium]